jgi:ferredoxin-NADP reductase
MSTYEVRLEGREPVAEGTAAFHFEKPAGFAFKPGQAIEVILGDAAGRHAFSIVSAPFQDELVVATRIRDTAFKQTLNALPVGATVTLDGPFGSLGLHRDRARPAVFIAGGIGITPFMSILRQAARDGWPQRLWLFYSNRRPEDAAFLAELQQFEQQSDHFRLVATMTQMSKSARPWAGETRKVDAELLKRCVGELAGPIYYVVGPPAMVGAMQGTLSQAGIAEDDIRSEEFYGY